MASIVAAWGCRNCRQLVSVCRLGPGGIRSALRTRRIVEALARWPSLSSSPWIRWYPQPVFSVASRSISVAISALTGGRPVLVRAGPLPGDQPAVPPQHGAGRDQPVQPQFSRQEPDQRGEDGAVGPVQPGPGLGAAQHGDLVPQHQELGVPGGRRTTEQNQPAADPYEDQLEQAEGHGRSSWPTADPGASPQVTAQADF